jgi:pilin/secretion family protein with methylation motif
VTRARGEAGVTLMELLVACLILGLIAVPITASVIVGLKTTDKAEATLEDGQATDLLSLYLARDLQNTRGATPISLGAADCRGSGTANVVFNESDGSTVSYNVEQSGGKPALMRRSSSTACARQVIAPGLATGYQANLDSTVFFYCGSGTTFTGPSNCSGTWSDLKMMRMLLSTPTGHSVELRANTRR